MSALAGKRILLTGGSMGIGQAIAQELAAQGARMLLIARGEEALDETLATLPGQGHARAALDVGDPEAWASLGAELDDLHGAVCAAAVIDPVGPVGSYDPAAFWATMQINVLGTLLTVHHALPALRASRGAIVTFSGGGATKPLTRYDAYATSKAAVVRLTENLAEVLAEDGIRINAVAPGFVATRMHESTLAAGPEGAGADYHERTLRDLEQGGVPPEQAAGLVALLLSDEGAGITGKLLSAQWDPWDDPQFRARLAADPDLATLRRIDDMFFGALPQEARA